MLILAQRWTTHNNSLMVEALVITQEGPNPSGVGDFHLYSAFYNPSSGQTLSEAVWNHRGMQGLLPALALLAMDILSHWALPPEEARDLKTYVQALEDLTGQVKAALQAQAQAQAQHAP